MNFHEAIIEPHDLTVGRLEAFCEYVGLAVDCGTITTLPLSCIVRAESRNCLSRLECLRSRVGIYAFQLGGCVIYVGKSGTGSQGLRDRIAQHLRERDTGGTLRINWFRQNGCDFAAFKRQIAECRLWTISFHQGCDNGQKIARLEHLLIGLTGPRYCDVIAPGTASESVDGATC